MAKRKPKTDSKPKKAPPEKPYACGTWTVSRFHSFIRSNLRLMSRKWPPITAALLKVRRAYKGKNKLQKWEFQCAECGEWHLRKNVHVEHKVPCGSLKCLADVPGFLERMLVEEDGLAVNCKACHQLKTNSEREARKANATADQKTGRCADGGEQVHI